MLWSSNGEPMPDGDTGDASPGVCEEEAAADAPSSSVASEALRDRAPIKLFFSLNFSIQLALNATWLSGLVVVAAKARALSRMRSSESGFPFFS